MGLATILIAQTQLLASFHFFRLESVQLIDFMPPYFLVGLCRHFECPYVTVNIVRFRPAVV